MVVGCANDDGFGQKYEAEKGFRTVVDAVATSDSMDSGDSVGED